MVSETIHEIHNKSTSPRITLRCLDCLLLRSYTEF